MGRVALPDPQQAKSTVDLLEAYELSPGGFGLDCARAFSFLTSFSAHFSYAGILSEPFLRSLAASGPGGRRAAVPVFGGLVPRIGHAVGTAHILLRPPRKLLPEPSSDTEFRGLGGCLGVARRLGGDHRSYGLDRPAPLPTA